MKKRLQDYKDTKLKDNKMSFDIKILFNCM